MKENAIGPRKVDKPLVLYGRGKLGQLAAEVFDKLGIPYKKLDKYDRYPPLGHGAALVAVCIASEPYQPIHDALVADGWLDVVSVYDVFEAYPECPIRSGWFAEAADWPEVQLLLKRFGEDDPEVWPWMPWMHYMTFWMWRRWHIETAFERTPIPTLPSTLADIEARRVVSLWKSPRSHIQLHSEGTELQTLQLNIEYLQKYRPQLDVTCYHSRDGLWKIPKFLMDNLPDYRFKFRLHSYMGQGAVLYCIPKKGGEAMGPKGKPKPPC